MIKKSILTILLISFILTLVLCNKGQINILTNYFPQEFIANQNLNTSTIGVQPALTNVVVASSKFPGYETYKNGRFGYSIDYPSNFVLVNSAANGDGIRLVSPDKEGILTVAGGNNVTMKIKDLYDLDIKHVKGETGYNVLENSYYVLTWKENEKINYEKMFVGTGSHNGFTFSYPEDQKSQYDDVITKLEASFQPGDTSKAW